MSKPIWKGFVSFGLVAIPVNLKPMEQKHNIHFHLLDNRDKSRIRYQRINTKTEKEVPWSEIVKAYEVEKNNYVVLNEEDFKTSNRNPEEKDNFNSIEITEFIPLQEIPPFYYERPYYIIPESKSYKAYVLLREALKKTKSVGVGKIIIRTKTYLSVTLPYQHSLLLNIIRYKQDLRAEDKKSFPIGPLKQYRISEQEMKMAISLIKEMTSDWNPEQYHDVEQETLLNWVKHKKKIHVEEPKSKPSKRKEVIDFMTLLKKSMAQKKIKKPKTSKRKA